MPIRHSKISTIPDGDNEDLVRPSDWNAEHDILVTELVDAVNLNTITTTGLYSQSEIGEAVSGSNYPVSVPGLLEVFKPSPNFCYQRYIRYDVPYTAYIRVYYNGSWGEWITQINNLNDGEGSGLDADYLDGKHGSYFLPAETYTASDVLDKLRTVDGTGSDLDADLLDGQHGTYYLPKSSYTASDILAKIKTVHGPGSGLNADLLDGQDSNYFLPKSTYTASDILSKLKTVHGPGSGLNADLLDGKDSSYFLPTSSYTATDVLNKIKSVDGTGSGLDTDLVNGQKTRKEVLVASFSIGEGSPVTSRTMSGFNFGTNTIAKLEFGITGKSVQEPSQQLYIQINGDSDPFTGTYNHYGGGWSSYESSNGISAGNLGSGGSSGYWAGKVDLFCRMNGGRTTGTLDSTTYVVGSWNSQKHGAVYHPSAENITSLRFNRNNGSFFGWAKLYQMID